MGSARRSLDVEPLEPFMRARVEGMQSTLGDSVRNIYYRARRSGRISIFKADEIAVAIGLHPADIWPDWWEIPITRSHASYSR
jgi:hypothetical protein